jgi:hypothetical protein
MPGLVLAVAFRVTGNDSPRTARTTFALMHLITFGLIAGLAARLWNPDREFYRYTYALAVVAVVPMSAFYGKMPNHEIPGLLFFVLGVFAWGDPTVASAGRLAAACAAWTLAAFSSWHAVLCIAGWLLEQALEMRWRRAAAAFAVVAGATTLVVVQLLWAGGWMIHPSQSASTRHWFAGSDGASLSERLGFITHTFSMGLSRYGQIPAILSLTWVVFAISDRVRGKQDRRDQGRGLVGLAIGSVAYLLLFPRAVSRHAYQGFYLLPFVALTSSFGLQRLERLPFIVGRTRLAAGLRAVALVATILFGLASTIAMYRRPSGGVIEVVRTLERQYR